VSGYVGGGTKDQSYRKKRIHVGCGPNAIKSGWWNIDIRNFKGIDEVRDITLPWTGLDAVQYVYGEHFIEHLTLRQALTFLANASAAMAENGIIRLSTPSLEWVLSTHYDLSVTEPNYAIQKTFQMNRAFHGWGHKFLWSKPMLKRALEAEGFVNIAFFPYGESNVPDLSNLEQHGGYSQANGYPSVWIVEGTRPKALQIDTEFEKFANLEFSRYVDGGH
jgi:predicted SAM-dependent methyltransferase